MLFKHLPLKSRGETYLSDKEQAEWIDRVVLPALRATCPPDITQHHPHSFKDAQGKSQVKREQPFSRHGQGLDVRYVIPESNLRLFWAEARQLARDIGVTDGPVPRHSFRNLVLIVSGHNLKLTTKNSTYRGAKEEFLRLITVSFNCKCFIKDYAWADLGIEDMLSKHDTGTTLL